MVSQNSLLILISNWHFLFFIIALEMRMYNMLEGVEDVLFGDRGISFTGEYCSKESFVITAT